MNELLQFLTQDLFTKFVGSAGLLAAFTSLLSTLAVVGLHSIVARRKLQAAEEAKFKEALESDDLLKLGDYLSSTLGQFTIQEYSSREQVAQRVNRMLARLGDFIGEGDVALPTLLDQSPVTHPPELSSLPAEFARVKADLENGDLWNGLARLRRIIELNLRQYGTSLGFKEKHLRSAGQALRLLGDRNYVPSNTVELLQYAIRLCNTGVHGNPVSLNDAMSALSAAVEGLHELDMVKKAKPHA